jgi:hypothetical protein
MIITLKNLNVVIPIYLQGYDRLLKKPSFLTRSVGSNVHSTRIVSPGFTAIGFFKGIDD